MSLAPARAFGFFDAGAVFADHFEVAHFRGAFSGKGEGVGVFGIRIFRRDGHGFLVLVMVVKGCLEGCTK